MAESRQEDVRIEELLAGHVADALAEEDEHELADVLSHSNARCEELALQLLVDRAVRELGRPSIDAEAVLRALPKDSKEQFAGDVMQRLTSEEDTETPLPRLRPVVTRRRTRTRGDRPRFVGVLAAAASIVLGLGVWVFVQTRGDGRVLPASRDALAVVTSVTDGAILVRAGQTIPVAQDVSLCAGDWIETEKGSMTVNWVGDTTSIEFADHTRVRLGALARSKGIRLERGELSAVVSSQPNDDPFIFATPNAVAKVLGTRLALATRPELTRLEVTEGSVRLTRLDDRASLDVRAGEFAVAAVDYAMAAFPIDVEPVDPALENVPAFGPRSGRPYGPSSPWNSPIPEEPVLAADSEAIVGKLNESVCANVYEVAIPIYDADERTPVRAVEVNGPWGPSRFEGREVRVPDGARPNTGPNGWLLVIDWHARRTWEFGNFRWEQDRVLVRGGGHVDIDGDGTDSIHTAAAGASILSGTIRVREIEAGHIPHALSFASKYAEAATSQLPARKTDGRYTGAGAVTVGARIQLDPSIDVSSIPGITRGEVTIARALQTYGAYCIGRTTPAFILNFELAPDATGAEYPGAAYVANGLPRDTYDMPHIPWDRLRVLEKWNGE